MATKKVDLRKVKISKYMDGSGEYVEKGYFHEWGKYGENQATYSIVEMEDGKVEYIKPNRIKFVDEF